MVWCNGPKVDWAQNAELYQRYKVWDRQMNLKLKGPLKKEYSDVQSNCFFMFSDLNGQRILEYTKPYDKT